jgi:hypothetical protein
MICRIFFFLYDFGRGLTSPPRRFSTCLCIGVGYRSHFQTATSHTDYRTQGYFCLGSSQHVGGGNVTGREALPVTERDLGSELLQMGYHWQAGNEEAIAHG